METDKKIKYPKLSREENLSCKLLDTDIDKIKLLRKNGWYLRELAEKFNVCTSTILYWVNDKYRKRELARICLRNRLKQIENPDIYRESSLKVWRRRMKDEKYKEFWRIYNLLVYYKKKSGRVADNKAKQRIK